MAHFAKSGHTVRKKQRTEEGKINLDTFSAKIEPVDTPILSSTKIGHRDILSTDIFSTDTFSMDTFSMDTFLTSIKRGHIFDGTFF